MIESLYEKRTSQMQIVKHCFKKNQLRGTSQTKFKVYHKILIVKMMLYLYINREKNGIGWKVQKME